MRKINFIIDEKWENKKIRDFLYDFGVSCALLTKLKQDEDGILLNGFPSRAIEALHTGDLLEITIKDSGKPPMPSPLFVSILYEDEDIIAASKPPGMPVHESRNHQGDALSNAVTYHTNLMGAFRCVYRLDRDTSGIVLIAKHELAASKLAGKVEKDYYAIVPGVFEGSGIIDKPIKRAVDSIIKRCVADDGERAITHWQAVKSHEGLTLLRIHLETGRTHQIRVHFASFGTPLLGDTLYGTADKRINRQALHCKTIRFLHPITSEQIEVDTDFPNDFKMLGKIK